MNMQQQNCAHRINVIVLTVRHKASEFNITFWFSSFLLDINPSNKTTTLYFSWHYEFDNISDKLNLLSHKGFFVLPTYTVDKLVYKL